MTSSEGVSGTRNAGERPALADSTGSLVWQDALAIPNAVAATIDHTAEIAELAEFLGRGGVERIVASGNGASYYVALVLALTAWASDRGPQVVAVPAGLLVPGRFRWRRGDVLLAFSSSGELKDLIEGPAEIGAGAYGVITSTPGSTLHRGAAAAVPVTSYDQRSLTHTQTYAGAVAGALAVWARLVGDEGLGGHLKAADGLVESALEDAWPWIEQNDISDVPSAAVTMGSGVAWAAALEAALLLKEVAGVPAEGVETREGATSAMFGLSDGSLVVGIETPADPHLAAAEVSCAGMGASTLRIPVPNGADQRLASLWSFPHALALALRVTKLAGRDPNAPRWAAAYLATVRQDLTAAEGPIGISR